MNTTRTSPSTRGLRALDLTVKALNVLLVAATALAVPILVLVAMGKGSISVNGTLETPYAVDFLDGRRVVVGGGSVSYENFDIGSESDSFARPPVVNAALAIDKGDIDTRVVVVILVTVWLAAAWVGLLSLRALIASVVAGAPFADQNSMRMRRLGLAILVVGVSGIVAQWALAATVDHALAFRVSLDTSTWLVVVVVGLGVLALAEPFAEAARLRAFDEAAI